MATPIQDLPGELWKPVVGFEGYYEVSNLGRVRGVDRMIGGPHGPRLWRGRLLAITVEKTSPYPRAHVQLFACGRWHTRKVHVLVARAFLGVCPCGAEVCHEDGDGTNNRIENLRYDTRRENILDQVRMRRHNTTKLTVEQVLEIRRRAAHGELASQLADDYPVIADSISNVIARRTWRHV